MCLRETVNRLEAEVAKWKRNFADAFMSEYSEAKLRIVAEVEREGFRPNAERYLHMRASAEFQDRNGPGVYWYLPRWDRSLPVGERLDAAVDSSIREKTR